MNDNSSSGRIQDKNTVVPVNGGEPVCNTCGGPIILGLDTGRKCQECRRLDETMAEYGCGSGGQGSPYGDRLLDVDGRPVPGCYQR